jgi:hypothetical protein
MDDIAIGRSPTLKALLVYNPWTKTCYKPDSYHIDPYWLPLSVYPQLQYNRGLFCYLIWDKNPAIEEAYPPGTQVERLDPTTKLLPAGTVMDISLSLDTFWISALPNSI